MSEARKEAWVEKKEGLLLNNKPSQSEPAKEEPKHDTRKEIAETVGLTRSAVTKIVPEGRQNVAENPIKSTSAAEELEAKQRYQNIVNR